MQKSILCYGDSNTWGYVPTRGKADPVKRYGSDIRWPRLLQKALKDSFYVIEEGLNGRTTNLNYHIPPDRNGKNYLPPCLYSHAPLDLVILALGGNDLKLYYGRQAEDIAAGMAELIDIVQTSSYGPDMQSPPQILLVAQEAPLPVAEHIVDENGIYLFKDAISRAKKLNQLYSELARQKKCHLIDLTGVATPSPIDGLHLDETGHQKVAEQMTQKIKQLFSTEFSVASVNPND